MVKFRAWIEELGRYADGVDVFHDGSWSAEIETLVLKGTPRECMGTEGGYGEREGDALEQFTGLFDKNGVEIYAGDIMHDPEDDENPYQVVWCEQSAQWQTHCEESESCSVFEMSGPLVEFAPSDVVIGNIHQHADLLKGES